MNPWPYLLAAYLLTAVGLLGYLGSVRRRVRAVRAQVAALPRRAPEEASR